MTWSMRATTLALFFAVCSLPAAAQNKIAFVRGQVLLNAAPGINERKALLQRETAYFEGEVSKMTDSLQKMQKAYQDAEPTLSPQTRETRRKVIEDQLQKFQKTTDSLKEVAGRRQDDVLQPILDAVNKILDAYRAEEGYAAIINLDDTPGVVTFDKNLDVTEALVARVKRITPMPAPASIIPNGPKLPPGPGGGRGGGAR